MYPLLEESTRSMRSIEPRQGTLGDSGLAGTPCWDSIAYINVLEHIADDAAELQLAHSVLRPGGTLLVFVPALQWLYSDFDRSIGHVRRYHREPLARLVRTCGFEILRLRYFDIAGVLPWLVTMVWPRGRLRPASVRLYDRLVTPVMRRIERVFEPPIGKNLLLVARRPADSVPGPGRHRAEGS